VALHFYGEVIASTNAGATWTETNVGSALLTSVAASADGRKIVAAARRTYYNFFPGAIFTSTNSGATWTGTSAPGQPWSSVASSADGTKLAAAGQAIYTSIDSGLTWTSNSAPADGGWSSIASSADGCKLVAAVNGGGIWTLQSPPSPSLSIVRANTNLVLSWIVPTVDFVLQENLDLPTANWTEVTYTPTLNLTNLQNQVRVSPTANRRFYRLKH